jgi:hypothetical protein
MMLLSAGLVAAASMAAASEAAGVPPAFGHGTAWPANHLWPADIRANLKLPGPPAAGRTAAVAVVPWYRGDVSPGPSGSAVSMTCDTGGNSTPAPNLARPLPVK